MEKRGLIVAQATAHKIIDILVEKGTLHRIYTKSQDIYKAWSRFKGRSNYTLNLDEYEGFIDVSIKPKKDK